MGFNLVGILITLLNLLIEYLYLGLGGICQAHRQAKLRLEYLIYCTNDIVYDRLRRIVHTAVLTKALVVRHQEVLVEVYHWVFLSGTLTIARHNLVDVRCSERLGKVIDNPRHTLIEVIARNVLEHLTQEWVSTRDEFRSLLTRECIRCSVVQTSCEHTVCNGLCV